MKYLKQSELLGTLSFFFKCIKKWKNNLILNFFFSFLKDETEQKIAELYKGSILNKVLNEKTKLRKQLIDEDGKVLKRCIIKMGFKNMQLIDLSDKYSLIRANTGCKILIFIHFHSFFD